jgi:hypothetical protein
MNMNLNHKLGKNEVAIFDYTNREVDIVIVNNLDEVEDLESVLIEMGYNPSEIAYMS